MFYKIAQQLMFKMEAERAHELALCSLKATAHNPLKTLYAQTVPAAPVTVMGITFPNPVGLAAGLDKNGDCIDAFDAMGFGFIEVGTVTPKPQAGNPKPRLFRLEGAEALINRMGFNNKGVDYLVNNLKAIKSNALVGVNIGKNKDTPIEQGKDDYLHCMEKVYAYAAYITVNISSPNTPGLRSLQYGELLDDLLLSLKQKQTLLAQQQGKYVPLALKIAPDLTLDEIKSIADAVLRSGFDAIIATNTTLARDAVKGLPFAEEVGGLSGKPLQQASTAVVQALAAHVQGKVPIIGVGGITSAATALEKLDAGASLIQLYAGFIYKGPDLIQRIVKACALNQP